MPPRAPSVGASSRDRPSRPGRLNPGTAIDTRLIALDTSVVQSVARLPARSSRVDKGIDDSENSGW